MFWHRGLYNKYDVYVVTLFMSVLMHASPFFDFQIDVNDVIGNVIGVKYICSLSSIYCKTFPKLIYI